MKKIEIFALAGICAALNAWALPADGLHPNSDAWPELFAQDLSDAEDTKGVWFRDAEGNLVGTLTVKAAKVSESARNAIVAAGGTVEVE